MLIAALSTLLSVTALPEQVMLGGDEAANASAIEGLCEVAERRVLDPETLPLAQDSHVQIDCDGFEYGGAPRRSEFVFADGRLSHIWVLVDASEVDGLDEAFEAAFGSPSVRSDSFSAYINANAAVRRDTPEALFYSDHVAPMFEGWFQQSAG
ncbi:MAG: hypothetical protein NXI12_11220 [Alphaproteobacteria bacterium]|nr:hypothetical protein [Alphaproteobacteria bacterium]